jgi:uncharacterized membrane-anchored protein YhcB (DUF1043 family)
MENRKMKEFFLKIIGFLIKVGVFIFALFVVFQALQKSFSQKGIRKEFEEVKEKIEEPLKEVKEKIAPEVNLSEKGLKIFAQIEIGTTTDSFSLSGIIDGNDLYWKLNSPSDSQNQLKTFQFLQNLIYGWKKFQVKDKEVEDLKKLKEILERKGIFKKFEKVHDGYEFEIDKEKLKEGIFEWKKEIPKENVEAFFKDSKEIFGKLLLDEKKLVKEMRLEGNSTKAIIKFENLEEEMKRKEGKELDFEKFLISIFENPPFI